MKKLGIRLAPITDPVLGPIAAMLVDADTGEEIGGVKSIALFYPCDDAVTATITLLVDNVRCAEGPVR